MRKTFLTCTYKGELGDAAYLQFCKFCVLICRELCYKVWLNLVGSSSPFGLLLRACFEVEGLDMTQILFQQVPGKLDVQESTLKDPCLIWKNRWSMKPVASRRAREGAATRLKLQKDNCFEAERLDALSNSSSYKKERSLRWKTLISKLRDSTVY